MRSLEGRLLVATPALDDPNFNRSVVLVLEHDGDGAIGVILNRPTRYTVDQALPQIQIQASRPAVAFVGGPIAPETAITLGERRPGAPDADPAWTQVVGSVGLIDFDLITETTAYPNVRLFAGYAGWAQGQLEAELAENAWIVVDATDRDITTAEPTTLWSTVLRRQPGSLALLAEYPDEPAWN